MVFRTSLPKLSLKFSNNNTKSSAPNNIITTTTPSLISPPSASSTPTSSKPNTPSHPPMTPPARLYLRNVLPTSPEFLPTPPPPPPRPRPWVWRCHSCHSIWRLAATHRCLECAHEYCSARARPLGGGPVTGESSGNGKIIRKRRRRNGPGSRGAFCAAEFDYVGWEEWGAWRRKVLGGLDPTTTPTQSGAAAARDRAFLTRTHDCWHDCDHPSQCHHQRAQLVAKAAAAEPSRRGYLSLQPVPEEEPLVASSAKSPDDELPMNVAMDITEVLEQDKENTAPVADTKQQQWRPVDEYKSQVVVRAPPAAGSQDSSAAGALRMPIVRIRHDSSHLGSGGRGKLMVRNSTEISEPVSLLPGPSSSSSSTSEGEDSDSMSDDSSDDDGYYEPANLDLHADEEDTRTPEGAKRDLMSLIEASKYWART